MASQQFQLNSPTYHLPAAASEMVVVGKKREEKPLSGFRFMPTDEQLVGYYLMKKITGQPINLEGMIDVELYSYSPDELAVTYPPMGEDQWYFFTSRDRKYKNGTRPKRTTEDGYWKATGADINIAVDKGSQKTIIGYRKSLVYYRGSHQKGTKTNWLMQEYRCLIPPRARTSPDDMKLDDFVLCKIYKNGRNEKKGKVENPSSTSNNVVATIASSSQGLIQDQKSPLAKPPPPSDDGKYHNQLTTGSLGRIPGYSTGWPPIGSTSALPSSIESSAFLDIFPNLEDTINFNDLEFWDSNELLIPDLLDETRSSSDAFIPVPIKAIKWDTLSDPGTSYQQFTRTCSCSAPFGNSPPCDLYIRSEDDINDKKNPNEGDEIVKGKRRRTV